MREVREKEKTWYDDSKMCLVWATGYMIQFTEIRSKRNKDGFRRKNEFVHSQFEFPAVHSLSGRLNDR